MEAIVKNRRQEILEKGEVEVKTLVEKKQLNRTSPETVARQRTREMIEIHKNHPSFLHAS